MAKVLKLSELLLLLKETIDIAFPDFYYVVAEINQLNIHKKSGHAYLDLIEKDTDSDKVIAKIKGIIWRNDFIVLNGIFKAVTGDNLKTGIKVLMKGYVNFNEVYGLSFIIKDIDPKYTLGDLAKKREEIIKRIESEGFIEMNKSLTFPLVPQRIAIISSPTAAGLGDFINHLEANPYGYQYFYKLFEAVMQGEETEQSVIKALDNIFGEIENFDIVVIIRGGGSKFDLSAFDSYELAINIAQFPLPVLTGIGHQRDLSVADLVAFKNLKTPTAVADFIISKTLEFENNLNFLKEKLDQLVFQFLENKKNNLDRLYEKLNYALVQFQFNKFQQLENLKLKLKNETNMFLLKKENQLLELNEKFRPAVKQFFDKKFDTIKNLKNKLTTSLQIFLLLKEKNLEILKLKINTFDPQNILKLGYTITTKNGKAVKSASELNEKDIIETYFFDGKIKSIVKK